MSETHKKQRNIINLIKTEISRSENTRAENKNYFFFCLIISQTSPRDNFARGRDEGDVDELNRRDNEKKSHFPLSDYRCVVSCCSRTLI